MRIELIVGAIVLVAIGFLAARYQVRREMEGRYLHAARDTVTVTVEVSREGQRLRIDVNPVTAEIRRGGVVEWQHNGDSLVIASKNDWPFAQRELRAPRGQRAASGRARPDAPRDTPFRYAITIYRDGEEIVIDPDIIIRW